MGLDHGTELAMAKFRAACAKLHTALAEAQRAADVVQARIESSTGSVYAPQRLHCIQTVVAEHFGYTRDRMLRRDRHHEIARARMTAMLLCRDLTRYSLEAIARAFGGMDHAAVMNACRQIPSRASVDADFAAELAAVRAKVVAALCSFGPACTVTAPHVVPSESLSSQL